MVWWEKYSLVSKTFAWHEFHEYDYILKCHNIIILAKFVLVQNIIFRTIQLTAIKKFQCLVAQRYFMVLTLPEFRGSVLVYSADISFLIHYILTVGMAVQTTSMSRTCCSTVFRSWGSFWNLPSPRTSSVTWECGYRLQTDQSKSSIQSSSPVQTMSITLFCADLLLHT